MTVKPLLLVVLLSRGAPATTPPADAEVTVSLVAHGGAGDDRAVTVTATPVGLEDARDRPPLQVAGSLRGSVRLRLAPGLWRLTAEADGLWWLPVEAHVDAPRAMTLRAWPAGLLHGTFSGARRKANEAPPRRLDASIEILGFGTPGSFVATEPCRLDGERFECDLPATPLVVRLQPEGFVPRYLDGVSPSASRPSRVPPLLPERGASIVGKVVDAETRRPAAEASVELRSASGEALGLAVTTTTNGSGFFQLVAASPASYTVLATHEGRSAVSEPFDVSVADDVRLSEPLGLRPPLTLRVRAAPPVDPDGRTWRIHLVRVEGTEARFVLRDSPADRRGAWTRMNLAEGRYLVRLVASSGELWATTVVDLTAGTHDQEIQAQACFLRGTVRVGDAPVSARVVLGGDRAPLHRRFQSDEAGAFEGSIPCREDLATREWSFVVETGEARRIADGVKLVGDAWEYRADLQLSDSVVDVQVVDESGVEIGDAAIIVVDAARPDRMQEATASDSGRSQGGLRIAGLADGRYSVQAKAIPNRVSDPLPFEVTPTSRRQSLRLVAREQVAVSGVVVTLDGSPVAGAALMLLPTHAVFPLAREIRSDASGRFEALLPASTREVALTASAYGSAFHMGRVPVERGRSLVVRLEPVGGTLVLRHDEPLASDVGAYILRDGAFVGAQTLKGWAAVHGRAQADGVAAIPQMQAGRYHVCRVPTSEAAVLFSGQVAPGCSAGELAPGGELELQVPRASR